MEGFLVLDYMSRVHGGDCRARRPGARGKLKNKVDVQHDLENAPETLRRLFEGRNEGKQLLRESNSSPLHMGWRQRPLSRSRWTRVGPFPYYDFTSITTTRLLTAAGRCQSELAGGLNPTFESAWLRLGPITRIVWPG
jgi:hypothetical protein